MACTFYIKLNGYDKNYTKFSSKAEVARALSNFKNYKSEHGVGSYSVAKYNVSRPLNPELSFHKFDPEDAPHEVFVQYFGKGETESTAKDLLETISSSGESAEVRALAKSLLENSSDEKLSSLRVVLESIDDWKVGETRSTPDGVEVALQKDSWSSDEDFQNTVLHEIVHGLSMDYIRNNPGDKAVTDLLSLQLSVLEDVRAGRISEDVMGTFGDGYSRLLYGLTGQLARTVDEVSTNEVDPVEVITHVLAEPEFKQFLKEVYPSGQKQSWWTKVVNSIKKFLGIKVNSSLVDKMSDASFKILQRAKNNSTDIGNYTGPRTAARPETIPNMASRVKVVKGKLEGEKNLSEDMLFYKNLLEGKKYNNSSKDYFINNILPHTGKDMRSFSKLFSESGEMSLQSTLDPQTTAKLFSKATNQSQRVLALEELFDNNQKQPTEPVSDSEYNDFIDKGVVSDSRLNSLVDKVINHSTMSPREQAMFQNQTSEINELVKKKRNHTKGSYGQMVIDWNNTQEKPSTSSVLFSQDELAERVQKINEKRLAELKLGDRKSFGDMKKDFLSSMDARKTLMDPYTRKSFQTPDFRIEFTPDTAKIPQEFQFRYDKGTSLNNMPVIVVPKEFIHNVNTAIRSVVHGVKVDELSDNYVPGDILIINGRRIELDSVESMDPVMKVDRGGTTIIFNGLELTDKNGNKYSLITSADTNESLEETFKRFDKEVKDEFSKDYHFQTNPGFENFSPIMYGYAVDPEIAALVDAPIFIDENAFYDTIPDNVDRNDVLKSLIESSNDVTIFSDRIAKPSYNVKLDRSDPENLGIKSSHSEQVESDENIIRELLAENGSLEKANLSEEYTKTSRTFAVDGLVEILDTGAILVSAEDIRNTPGLPTGLSSLPSFSHNGKIYINYDMIGPGAVVQELRTLFIDHVKKVNEPLYERILNLARKSEHREKFRSTMPKASDDEVDLKTFMYIADNKFRQMDLSDPSEFTGTMNEFTNHVDKVLGEIDPTLSKDSVLEEVALAINKGIFTGRYKFADMLRYPDAQAAKFATGKFDVSNQINNMIGKLIESGKIIQNCD